MTNALVKGSLSAIAQQSGKSLAESFIHCDAVVIVDTSGSMQGRDAPGGKSRYQAAIAELTALQEAMPGKLAVLSFSSTVEFCPAGVPTFLGGGTDVAGALQFARIADVPGMTFFLISDGEPNNEAAALDVARTFSNKINTIFVGPEQWGQAGRDFLRRLAEATGGQSEVAELTRALGSTVQRLMLTAQ